MPLLRSLLPFAYPALRAGKMMRRLLAPSGTPALRVLLYHDVAPTQLNTFSRQLQWLQKRWHFLTPTQFEAIVDGSEKAREDSLLLSFDDGFASNRVLAEKVLKPLDIQAIFFVVSEFIDQPDAAASRRFIFERLKAGRSPEALPAHWTNMSWDDLQALRQLGHTIGAHTASHERLTSTLAPQVMEQEIIADADRLQARLGCPVRHFAYPFGDLASFSQQAMALAARRFDYVYSGLRGDNLPHPQRHALRRDSQTPLDSHGLLGAFLEGASDARYRRNNGVLDRWARDAGAGGSAVA